MPALRIRDAFSQWKPIFAINRHGSRSDHLHLPLSARKVITDTIHPPSLAIISPTSPAFISPFNKPIPVLTRPPFEPDLRQLTLTLFLQSPLLVHQALHLRLQFFPQRRSRARHLRSPHIYRHPYRAQT
jgi:hypothetical protein